MWVAVGLGLLTAIVLAWPRLRDASLTSADVAPSLVDDLTVFPPARPELPVATPLAPLLAGDAPEELAVLSPGEGGLRVRRGETYVVRFNRPMVAATLVGLPVTDSPLIFTPSLPGTTRWVSRSSVAFVPDEAAFTRSRQAQVTFAPGLTSADGSALLDEAIRSIVCDGTPRASEGPREVAVGAPLEVHFDAPVSVAELAREMLVFERGGGSRTLPVSLRARGWVGRTEDETGTFVVDVALRRDLEPGSSIAVALAPRFASWGGYEPYVLGYELAPRPHVDGIACDAEGGAWASCGWEDEAPGDIVDIGPELILRASHPLVPGRGSVVVSPPVRGASLVIGDAAAERARFATITAEWEPDQVYEVRVVGLETASGPIRAAPLAVRSAGRAPEVRAASGLLTFERDAELALPVEAVHGERGTIRTWPVPWNVAVETVLGIAARPAHGALPSELPDGLVSRPLAALVPGMRANRWGRGRFVADVPAGPALVRVELSASGEAPDVETLLLRSDLALSVLAVGDVTQVWVTSLDGGAPVAGAEVRSFDAYAHPVGAARTDASGVATLPRDTGGGVARVFVARSGDDQTMLRFDARAGVTNGALEVYGGADGPDEETRTRALVRTDRGLYRPGETLHVLGMLREVDGVTLSPAADRPVSMRLVIEGDDTPRSSAEGRSSSWGMVDATLTVPAAMPLGTARIELLEDGAVIGAADVRIAQYREPRLRVDVSGPSQLLAGETAELALDARYLFGASARGSRASLRVVRRGQAPIEGHAGYVFSPADAAFAEATLEERTLDLVEGRASVVVTGTLAVSARTELAVEADVTDPAGEASTVTRVLAVRPAEIEVGLRQLPSWIRWGEAIDAEVVAIDGADHDVAGTPLEVRFSREGWHGYWEWHGGDDEGHFARRAAQRRVLTHRCALTSAEGPVTCSFAPEAMGARAGTYLVEVEAVDAHGRHVIASQRVYVAGPDESPDRDPPGAPLELTPRVVHATLGGVAEIAFECPWPEAEAWIVVSQGTVLHSERQHVTGGGHVVRLAVDPAWAPNAFVTVTLVRPRTGAPGGELDLHAPDLRFGGAEIVVRPPTDALVVTVAASEPLAPGVVHDVELAVTDGHGQPVEAELAVWASDEGTLRATGYALRADPDELFPRFAAQFALDDTRRVLRSRVLEAVLGAPSGDGDEGGAPSPTRLTERDRYDPTPLFVGRVRTDAAGRARVPFHLPERLTEYRVMAIATDAQARIGTGTGARVVTRDVVIRAATPPFLVAGDEAELAFFVHNRTGEAREVSLAVTAAGAGVSSAGDEVVSVPANGEIVARRRIAPTEVGVIELHATASHASGAHAVTAHVTVIPRGRTETATAVVMGADGLRPLDLALPPGAALEAIVAAHPFVALPALVDDLDRVSLTTVELDAARVTALAALLALDRGAGTDDHPSAERRARLAAALARIADRQNEDGGVAWYPGEASEPRLALAALESVLAARRAGIEVDGELVASLVARLEEDVLLHALGAGTGTDGVGLHFRALRVLHDAGRTPSAEIDAGYEMRQFVDGASLLELWLAMEPGDRRRTTVLSLAEERLGIDRDHDEPLGLPARVPAVLATLARVESERLVSATRRPTDRSLLPEIGGALFEVARAPGVGPLARADVLAALTLLAGRFTSPEAPALSLSLNGRELTAERRGLSAAHFLVPIDAPSAALSARRGVPGDDDHGPVFLATSARWTVPLGEDDDDARGRGAALHRIYETPSGHALGEDDVIAVGDLVRVRLFVHIEDWSTSDLAIRDPHLAGLAPIDGASSTSPLESLRAVLGVGPSDDRADPRAYHAERTEYLVRHVAHEAPATTFYVRALPPGLHELTYVVRATTAGRFVAPPAELEPIDGSGITARSRRAAFTVTRPEAP